jgi:hypothetical protein
MLNRSISLSIKFHQLPDDTCRLLATWLIAYLDVNGVFYADPAVVRSLVMPRRTDISSHQINSYLNAMSEIGLITLFEAQDQIWMHWPGFAENQAGLRQDRETTDLPKPESIQQHAGIFPENSRELRENSRELRENSRELRENSRETPAEDEDEAKYEAEYEAEDNGSIISSLSSLFGQHVTKPQERRFEALRIKHPHTFENALKWAATRGMTPGEALTALTTALPNWTERTPKNNNGSKRWYTDEEYEQFFGIRTKAEKANA